MKAAEVLDKVTRLLKKAGLQDALNEAMALLRQVSGMGQAELIAHAPEMSDEAVKRVMEAAERRAAHEPLQYITGSVEFMDMTLKVGSGVLVPRPETELLVTEFYRLFPDKDAALDVLDLCTGSGCIALAIACHYLNASVSATDFSADALAYARLNARELGADNLNLLHGSLYTPLERGEVFDAITANPPYIPKGEIAALMPEVSVHEPRSALDGGADGLDFYKEIIESTKGRLKSGGLLLFELGAGQCAEVSVIAEDSGLFKVESVIKDYSGHERVLVLKRLT